VLEAPPLNVTVGHAEGKPNGTRTMRSAFVRDASKGWDDPKWQRLSIGRCAGPQIGSRCANTRYSIREFYSGLGKGIVFVERGEHSLSTTKSINCRIKPSFKDEAMLATEALVPKCRILDSDCRLSASKRAGKIRLKCAPTKDD
jgi:hypothetical protein